jgi:hypothetical protein
MYNFLIIGSILIFLILLTVYYRNWRHPDGFTDSKTTTTEKKKEQKVIPVEYPLTPPFATDSIRSVDDYEYNMVFQNEGDRSITKAQRDMLMSSYPMDWSVQPPSSALFQQGLAKFKESFQNQGAAPTVNPFKDIDGSTMTPPDTWAIEQKEREILATYVPKRPNELTTYDAADAKELIHKIYDAKGLIPDYKETGKNIFTIVGTRRKDEKVLYEGEEAEATVGPNPSAGESAPVQPSGTTMGEAQVIIPAVASEVQQGLDPFFTAGQKTRDGRIDYTRWTPGLERMFAPTESMTNWY